MSNWPLLFVSLSLTFHICRQCGPRWQQTALLSILNFCSELQHLSLGSCIMVSIWKFFLLPRLFSLFPWANGILTRPLHTHLQLFRFTVNYGVPRFQTFFLNWRVCLQNIDTIYLWEQGKKCAWLKRVWFCLKPDVISEKLFTSLDLFTK